MSVEYKALEVQAHIRRARIVLTSVMTIALAFVSGAHALSSAIARSSPEFAIALWPSNGLAHERLAFRYFVGKVRESLPALDNLDSDRSDLDLERATSIGSDQLRQFAVAAAPGATRALQDEPLLPKAHAILALSQKEILRREKIITLASRLNRRDLSLQGLVLETYIASGDYRGAIATLDQILRVHPQRQAEFFPALTMALRQANTIPAFRDVLSKPLPWRDSFLMFAVEDPVAALNLAALRETNDFDNYDFDKRLISNLMGNNDTKAAELLYQKLNNLTSTEKTAWLSAYPPFDWTFADQPGLRAQLNKDGSDLEFAIDPGRGGALASKLIDPPEAPFTLTVRHQLVDPSLSKDLKLSLTCINKTQPFFEAHFAERNGRFDVEQEPGCGYVLLAISGRSWSGAEPLNGSITDVLIAAR